MIKLWTVLTNFQHFNAFLYLKTFVNNNGYTQPALEFVKNKFGRDNLVLDGYRYRFRSRRDSRIYWKYVVNTCPATINTHDQHLVKRGYQYNHTSNQPKIEVMKVIQTMKNRSRYEVTPILTIYDEKAVKLRTPERDEETRQTVEQLPTYYSSKSSLYQ